MHMIYNIGALQALWKQHRRAGERDHIHQCQGGGRGSVGDRQQWGGYGVEGGHLGGAEWGPPHGGQDRHPSIPPHCGQLSSHHGRRKGSVLLLTVELTYLLMVR